jgi:hypothetical protein
MGSKAGYHVPEIVGIATTTVQRTGDTAIRFGVGHNY